MRELFGVKIELIEPDYRNKFYRIKAETPFLPEDAKAEQKKEEAEISLNGADSDLDQEQAARDEKQAEKDAAAKKAADEKKAAAAAEKAAKKGAQ